MSVLGHNSDEIDFKKIRSEFPILQKKFRLEFGSGGGLRQL